jgi:hypothetical protein
MCTEQRLRVNYVLALGLAAVDAHNLCVERLDVALELAAYLEDARAMSTLHYLRGCANRERFRYHAAAADYRRSLELLTTASLLGWPVEPLEEVHLLTAEATAHFYLGDYSACRGLLEGARVRVPAGAGNDVDANTISWIQALVDRWEGHPERALPQAQRAAEAYMRAGPSCSAVRIQTFVAEIELDLAETAPSGSARRAMHVGQANAHLDTALELAGHLHDANGEVRTQLLQARASRLRRENIGRVGLIETLAQEGHRLHDDVLVVQAFTTLGDELMAQGEETSGLNCYREAFNRTDGGDLVAFSLWARKAFRQQHERHT